MSGPFADALAEVMVRSDLAWGRTVTEHPSRDGYESMADAVLASPEMEAIRVALRISRFSVPTWFAQNVPSSVIGWVDASLEGLT